MEVMVSVSIFAIIVTVGIVSLLTINDAYRKSQTERQAIDSMTYMLESMSRRIRTALTWSATSFGSPSSSFSFADQDLIGVNYHWDGSDKLFMDIVTDPGSVSTAVPVANNYDLTPAQVHISTTLPDGTTLPGGGVSFLPLETTAGVPYLQINVGGYVTNGKQISPFQFQTGVSKRVIDGAP
ncbi:MAG: hypothetical protein JWM20_539 [Patescibacteria group bacterium]|nr:hypothetical protein [Patescibacteria group bacterium]